jgi:hypothetical protein
MVALQASCIDSHLDEMVQLCSAERPAPEKPPPEHVRRVFFKKLDDILPALSTGPPGAQTTPLQPETSNPEAIAENGGSSAVETQEGDEGSVEQRLDTSKPEASAENGGNSTIEAQGEDTAAEAANEQQIEQPEADVTDLVDPQDPNLVESFTSTAAPLAVEHSSQEQRGVALRLLHGYRQLVRNKKLEKQKTATQKTCNAYFKTCLKLASDPKEMQWPCGFYYRKLYLGLVPHLLACVKAVESYAFTARAKARIRYRKEEKQDYDGVHKRMNEIGYVFI